MNTTNTPKPPQRTSKRKKILLISGIAAVAVALIIGIVVVTFSNYVASSKATANDFNQNIKSALLAAPGVTDDTSLKCTLNTTEEYAYNLYGGVTIAAASRGELITIAKSAFTAVQQVRDAANSGKPVGCDKGYLLIESADKQIKIRINIRLSRGDESISEELNYWPHTVMQTCTPDGQCTTVCNSDCKKLYGE